MPFHVLAYQNAAAFGGSNVDTPAAVDPSFSIRNNHYIFTEQYGLAAAYATGPSLTTARISTPTINAIAPAHVFPVNRSALFPTPENVMDLRDYPLAIPQNEEIAVQVSNNATVGTDQEYVIGLIVPQGWNLNLPQGIRRLFLRATAAVTLAANAWSADAALTFEQSPKGGWYWLVGAFVSVTNGVAFRVNFPRMPLIAGRKLFPGATCMQAVSDLHHLYVEDGMGVYGKFHTFEPPLLAVFGSASGAQTAEVRLDVIYAGEGEPSFQGF